MYHQTHIRHHRVILGTGFTDQMTRPTVSKNWRKRTG